jgi:hypothetical protein
MTASNKFQDTKRPFFRRKKGASGSWAEPYFACPTLRYGGFAYPPGILVVVFSREIKEIRILSSIRNNKFTDYIDETAYSPKNEVNGRRY